MKPNDRSTDRGGIFVGDDPFQLARSWLAEAAESEPNDPDAAALATVDAGGLPNVRMVLLKAIEPDGFVFFTNYESRKAQELTGAGKAAFVMHWKSLDRQIRARGVIDRVDAAQSDKYFRTRSIYSRIGAWASRQSDELDSRKTLENRVAALNNELGDNPGRPDFWGGFRMRPLEIEFWCHGADRLHDRFLWRRENIEQRWEVVRLYP